MDIVFAYITTSNKEEAKRIGRVLLEKKVAACVNMIDKMESLYWWEGKIEEGNEAILIAKTRRPLVKKLVSLVKALHSYSCPCVLTFSMEDGNSDYIKWLEENTA